MLPEKEWQLVQELLFAFNAIGGTMPRSDLVCARETGPGE
jgi:hypothetical protein